MDARLKISVDLSVVYAFYIIQVCLVQGDKKTIIEVNSY